MRSLIIIVCIIFGPLLSIANAQEPAPRSRSAFIPNQTESKDLVLLMNQAQENEAVGEVSVYVPVRFRYDSSELTSDARKALLTIARALQDASLNTIPFVVEGHADATGSAEYNQVLSLRRARSAANYLVVLGVKEQRLSIRGRGEEDPLEGVSPYAAENRRIEIVQINR